MDLYRIVKTFERASDLSGTGSFNVGGRWNSKGTYMLYTSENSSLAYLESLVHFDVENLPSRLFIMHLQLVENIDIYTLPDKEYPADWIRIGSVKNQLLGNKIMNDKKYIGFKVRSAINTFEYNILLNPLFPRYYDYLKVKSVTEIRVDERLLMME
jgi:RES domain-containing protein